MLCGVINPKVASLGKEKGPRWTHQDKIPSTIRQCQALEVMDTSQLQKMSYKS